MEQWFLTLIRGDRRGIVPNLLRGLLCILSLFYGCAVHLRNRFYDWGWRRIHRASVPVVSVGNLTMGGTGKTPCVEYVARQLRAGERQVAILSRGYAADRAAAGHNDEALVLEHNLPDVPHLQSPDRAALARIAVEELESEVLVLDDGFQHRRLHRDLDLVLVDATCPWGGGFLFPRGLMRETASSLRRAQVVLLTRCDQVERRIIDSLRQQIARHAPNADIIETRHQPSGWINGSGRLDDTERDCNIAAFCGIGNPSAFRRTLVDLGYNIADFRTYPDHHNYTRADVEELHAWARKQPDNCWIATTQKDLVKLQIERLGQRELWALVIQLQVDAGRNLLEARLQSLFGGQDQVLKSDI